MAAHAELSGQLSDACIRPSRALYSGRCARTLHKQTSRHQKCCRCPVAESLDDRSAIFKVAEAFGAHGDMRKLVDEGEDAPAVGDPPIAVDRDDGRSVERQGEAI